MTEEELEARIAFEKDPDAWMEQAEKDFQDKVDIVEAVLAGKISAENLSYADLVILELRTMEAIRQEYIDRGTHAVMSDLASNYYN